jgi:hypothetical protein
MKVQFRPGPLHAALVERADAGESMSKVAQRDLTRVGLARVPA